MDAVLRIVERSNQRGGRMLSVVDLLEARTLTLRQAAWLLERIEQGASWVVGARPGGAGKTTIMSALLAMLPAGETVRLANAGTGWREATAGECVVAYEISPGHYDAYVWGNDVAQLGRLALEGVRVVTNLHADTLGQARQQIVEDCGAAPAAFDALDVFLPIEVAGGFFSSRRCVSAIYAYRNEMWREVDPAKDESERARAIARFLHECRKREILRVESVRAAWLDWRGENPM